MTYPCGTFIGKASFVAPVLKFSENLTAEVHVHCTSSVRVYPICSDEVNKIEVSRLRFPISLITT